VSFHFGILKLRIAGTQSRVLDTNRLSVIWFYINRIVEDLLAGQ
jgi:hypothetical protein